MTKTKSTKRAFISSLLMLSLCFTMLVGTTFAWYTDSVTSSGNKIVSGTLDIQLWKYDGSAYVDISNSSAPIFKSSNIAQNSTETLWEPGKTQIAYLMIKNNGNLHLKYQVALDVYNVSKDLYKVMKYKIIPDAKDGELNTLSWTTLGGLEAVSLADTEIPDNGSYSFLTSSVNVDMAPGDIHYFALAIHMEEEAGNEYMNGEVDFDLKVLATQNTVEYDSFNNQYDAQSVYPEIVTGSAIYSGTAEDTTVIAGDTDNVGAAKITIPAGTATVVGGGDLTEGENVNLYVEETETPANFVVQTGNSTTTYEVSLETDSGAKIVSNGEAFIVDLNIGVVDLQQFAHNGEAMTPVDSKSALTNGKYYYDVENGIITFMTTSFSPFTSEYLFDGGLGTEAYPYLIKSVDSWNAIKTAEYFELAADIDFKGTAPQAFNRYSTTASTVIFGKGHVIKNASGPIFPQDWIYNLIIKDLTIENSTSNYSMICNYGVYASKIGIEFDNVDVKNCSVKGGSFFLPWVYENYAVSFKNCDVVNSSTKDNGAQGFSGAFTGNSKASVVVDSCTLTDVTIEGTKYDCGAFVGGYAGGTVKNSIANSGTTIIQMDNEKSASAIGGSVTTIENCEFYGTLKTEKVSKALFQGFASTGTWSEITPSVVGSDFVIGTDGTITYNGTGSFAKVKVSQKVNIDRLLNGAPENGGFPYIIGETTTFTNVENGTAMAGAINYITAFRNVAPEYSSVLKDSITSLPAGLSFNNSFAIDNGIAYLDASEGESSKRTDYVSGTYISNNVAKATVTVYFAIYDSTDTLISITSNTYKVDI